MGEKSDPRMPGKQTLNGNDDDVELIGLNQKRDAVKEIFNRNRLM